MTWKRILEKAIDAAEIEEVFGRYLRLMSEDEPSLWNLDGKVVCSVKSAKILTHPRKLRPIAKR